MTGRDVFVVDAVRTPVGRHGGALADVRPDDLGAVVIRALLDRTTMDPGVINDVILGCANQAGEDNRNVARMSALLAGLPVSVPGVTVNRLCGSGLEAVAQAARAIACGEADVIVAGGVESMSRAPFVMSKPSVGFARGDLTAHDTTLGWRMVNPRMRALGHTDPLGETAEKVADRFQISRTDQDQFALQSQQRWAAAQAAGRFNDEIVAVDVPGKKGAITRFTVDEHPRPHTTALELAALAPVFRKNGGTVTAGNSSGLNDGASALLLASAQGLTHLGATKALARIRGTSTVGVEPAYMGTGPIGACQTLLGRLGLRITDMDLVELNEAFAAQALACTHTLGLPAERVNVNGGAIAIGHPLGASGARIVTTLVHELRRRDAGYGLASLCIGVGQGIAMVVERVRG